MSPLKIEIVTAERTVYTEEGVEIVIAPGIMGQLGILPRHAPLLTALQPGELRIRKDGQETELVIMGGFMEVFNDQVIILANAAERADEINEERAREAMRRAEERIKSSVSDTDLQRALASLRRSQTRLKVAQRRRRTGRPETGSTSH